MEHCDHKPTVLANLIYRYLKEQENLNNISVPHNKEYSIQFSYEDFLIDFTDLIKESKLVYENGAYNIDVYEEEQEKNYEIERRNATGGVYCTLSQDILLRGTIGLKEENGKTIFDPDTTDLEFRTSFRMTNVRSHSGEKPPY